MHHPIRTGVLGLIALLAIAAACSDQSTPARPTPLEPGAAQSAALLPGAAHRSLTVQPPTSRYGVVVLGDQLGDPTQGPTVAQYAADAHVGWVRIPLYWELLQPNGPNFDPAALALARRKVQNAVNAGLNVYATLEASPSWARYDRPGCVKDHRYPPSQDMWIWWQRFVKGMVDSIPDVDYWGIWNEPNAPNFFQTCPETTAVDGYGLLVEYAAPQIRNTPAVHQAGMKKLVAPEIGGDPNMDAWFNSFMAGHSGSTDVTSIHQYAYSYDASAKVTALKWPGKPMWMTESGFWEWADDSTQASQLTNVLQHMQTNGNWDKTFFYELNVTERNYELLRNGTQQKPAYYCLQAFIASQPLPHACTVFPQF